jgi:hypothetical protein
MSQRGSPATAAFRLDHKHGNRRLRPCWSVFLAFVRLQPEYRIVGSGGPALESQSHGADHRGNGPRSPWTGGGCAPVAANQDLGLATGSELDPKARTHSQRIVKLNEPLMILPRTIWSVTEPVPPPGSLMARCKEWVPCASLADLGNDTMCAPCGCTDSRLSQVIET